MEDKQELAADSTTQSPETAPENVATTPSESTPPASTPSSTSSNAPTSTTAVRPSGLPKPSGLKPPSKIGRLCSNSTPKPAVPISPRTDGSSTDTLRKLSGDYSRKHLSDLVEAEEDGEVCSLPSDSSRPHRKASTSSTYSITSMDALWEKHPRRLSEAGLRRSSDHSVVLTEDTDSFIIGDRVWVGGTKPGQIAYIGETQFAPGEWAGIVLDDAIGKNDGSVAGVRYFQCAEKRGVFSRLTRLTRTPIVRHDSSPMSDAGSVFDRPPSGTPKPRRNLSPNGSIRSAISSKMNASVTTSGGNGELRLGERVIVSSSRGSKAGTLRYVGGTEFASGVWAGVELDDPLGKNDGSVEGKRYFDCSPRFGLFAPISKVSRSPSNRKPGACAIHSNGRATPLRRSNSRESFTSLGSSIASSRVPQRITSVGGAQRMVAPRASSTPVSAKNALQELLREKQKHLERLMMERELEKSDVADVTIRAERAETILEQVKKDAATALRENENLKLELEKLNKILEDERQKVEDLMFSNEEENINKEDYNKYREEMEKQKLVMEQRIRELEAEAGLQAARAEAASNTARAVDEQRINEIASLNEQHKEELSAAQTLSTELQKLLDEAYALLQEKESEKDSIGKSMSEELFKLKIESEKALNEAKTKMAIAQTEYETQMSVLTAKLQLAESKLESERQNLERLNKDSSQTVIDLNAKLSQLQATLDDKTYELNKVLGSSKEHEVNLNKEITKLKIELSAKINDYEQLMEDNSKQEAKQKALETEISNYKQELVTKINEYETLLNEVSQQNESSKLEIMQLQQNLAIKSKDYEKLLADSGSTNSNTEKLINEYKQTIHERDKEIIKLKHEYEQANANFNIQQSKIAEEYKKDIDERNVKIEQLLKEINTQKQTLESSKVEFDTLNSQYNVNVDEINLLRQQNEELRKSVNELSQINMDLKNKVAAMELEIGELNRQLSTSNERIADLQITKEKVESEYMNLTGQATDSNEQFNKLSQHLKDTEKELHEMKEKHRESTNTFGRIEQELKQQIFKLQDEYSLERTQLLNSIDVNVQKQKQLETKLNENESQVVFLKNQLKDVETNKDKTIDENTILKQEIAALQNKEIELNEEYQKAVKQMQEDIYKHKEQISLLKEVGESSEVKLKEKVDQLIEAQNELNNKLEESRKQEDTLQKIVDDVTVQLNNQKLHFEKELAQEVAKLSQTMEEINRLKSEEVRLKELMTEKDNNIKELTLKIGMSDVDLKSNLDMIAEKERQLENINTELSKANENKKCLEDKLNDSTLALADLKQKYEAILSNSTAEGSLLKEQQQQMETLKKDLTVLSQEKLALESVHKHVNDEFVNLKDEHNVIVKKLDENIDANNKLKALLGERDITITTQNQKHETELNKIKHIEQELSQVKQDVMNKNNDILEKERQIQNFNEILQSNNNETQVKLKALQEENETLSSKYKSEVETLNQTLTTLQAQIAQKEQTSSEEVSQAKNRIVELQGHLEKSENELKQLRSFNEGQKSNYEELNLLLKAEYDEYKKEAKRSKSDLKTKLSQYENELKDSKYKFSEEIAKQMELQRKLQESEKIIIELNNKLELFNVQQNANVQKDDKLEQLTLELQATRKSNSETIANNESVIKKMKYDIENKVKTIKDKEVMILGLQDELKNQKAKIEITEREKVLLQKELSSLPKDAVIKDSNDNGLSLKESSLKLEEREEVEGQVSFLNSVIVDMQRKNEQLTARVRALEAGTPESVPTCNGRLPKAVAPRLFCDICDVFDAHDTEDCPRQCAMDEPEPPTQRKPPPPPRPYCDICEVFGHATENCDEEETF